ncbi:hypothetical protein X766_00285 [Mesorhizobium sp. LSJC255A00]|nr:hypothetical protein X766_00285 [Mesorhizobium sp. LSJC255A00]
MTSSSEAFEPLQREQLLVEATEDMGLGGVDAADLAIVVQPVGAKR